MVETLFQIKRSPGHLPPTSLKFGEPAWVEETNTLYIGKADETVIGIPFNASYQPLNSRLNEFAALSPANGAFVVGNGSSFVLKSGLDAQSLLGLGSAAIASVNDFVGAAEKGVAGGVAMLDGTGKVPAAQLPAFNVPVQSVFGRTGAVVAKGGDYTAAQVGALAVANDLSDINNVASARNNLGLGTAAIVSSSYLLDRENHSGTQPISTVAGLQIALDEKLSGSELDYHQAAPILDHPDGSVTDIKIGNRTISDSSVPTNLGPGSLTQWLEWLVNRIKSITGRPNWWETPATTLEATASHLANTSNPHQVTAAQVGAIPLEQKGMANGVATLDAGGKVPTAQIPAIAINDTFPVNSEAEMLALTAEVGDVAVRLDSLKTFILRLPGPSTLSHWQEILTPTTGVTSVFGRSGVINAQSGDYTAAQVGALAIASNLSDLNSPSIARNNLGLGSLAIKSSLLATDIPNLDAAKITTGVFADNQIPASIARDSEVQSAVSSKIDSSEKGAPGGVASLDASGKVLPDQLPELGAVQSVFGRTGAVVPQAGDYNSSQISGLGTIATQNANNVAIAGGAINATAIGATAANTGRFTTLFAAGLTQIGGAGLAVTSSTAAAADPGAGNIQASGNLTVGGSLTMAPDIYSVGKIEMVSATGRMRFNRVLDCAGGLVPRQFEENAVWVSGYIDFKAGTRIVMSGNSDIGSANQNLRLAGDVFNTSSPAYTVQARSFVVANTTTDAANPGIGNAVIAGTLKTGGLTQVAGAGLAVTTSTAAAADPGAGNAKIEGNLTVDGTITAANFSGLGNAATQSKDSAIWNANRLQSQAIATTAPTDAQILTWNGTAQQWEPRNTAPSGIMGPSSFTPDAIARYDAAGNLANSLATIDNSGKLASLGAKLSGLTQVAGAGLAVTSSTAAAADPGAGNIQASGNLTVGGSLTMAPDIYSVGKIEMVSATGRMRFNRVLDCAGGLVPQRFEESAIWVSGTLDFKAGTRLLFSGNSDITSYSQNLMLIPDVDNPYPSAYTVQAKSFVVANTATRQSNPGTGNAVIAGTLKTGGLTQVAGAGLAVTTSTAAAADPGAGNAQIDGNLTVGGTVTAANFSGLGSGATQDSSAPVWNANKLQNRAIAATAPADQQVLGWNNAAQTWQPQTVAIGAGGSSGQLQFNNSGAFSGADFTAINATTRQLTISYLGTGGSQKPPLILKAAADNVLNDNLLEARSPSGTCNAALTYEGKLILGGQFFPTGYLDVRVPGSSPARSMVYDSNGSLVVTAAEGTTGAIRLGAAYGKKGFYSDSDLHFTYNTSLSFRAEANGTATPKATLLSDGKLGIGTATPGALLQVAGGGLAVSTSTSAASDPGAGNLATDGNISSAGQVTATGTLNRTVTNTSRVSLGVATTPRVLLEHSATTWEIDNFGGLFRINNGGNSPFTIGTNLTTQVNSLSVASGSGAAPGTGNAAIAGNLSVGGAITTTGTETANKFRVQNTAIVPSVAGDNYVEMSVTDGGNFPVLNFGRTNGGTVYVAGGSGGFLFTGPIAASGSVLTGGATPTLGVNGVGALKIASGGANPINFFTNSTQKATILSDGKFGIGTSTPGALLQVAGGGLAVSSSTSAASDPGAGNVAITGTLTTGGAMTSVSLNGAGASGIDTAGTDLAIAGGKGTGTGAGGKILFQAAAAGTTGSAQNAVATVASVDSTGLKIANSKNLYLDANTSIIGTRSDNASASILGVSGFNTRLGSIGGGSIELYTGSSVKVTVSGAGDVTATGTLFIDPGANLKAKLTNQSLSFSRLSDGAYATSITHDGTQTITYNSRTMHSFTANSTVNQLYLTYDASSSAPQISVGANRGAVTGQSTFHVQGNVTVGSSYGGITTCPANGIAVQGRALFGTSTDDGGTQLQVGGTGTISATTLNLSAASGTKVTFWGGLNALTMDGSANINWTTTGRKIYFPDIGSMGIGCNPGAKLQVAGGVAVTSSTTTSADPGAGNLKVDGNINAGGAIAPGAKTVATLPASGNVGQRYFCSDAVWTGGVGCSVEWNAAYWVTPDGCQASTTGYFTSVTGTGTFNLDRTHLHLFFDTPSSQLVNPVFPDTASHLGRVYYLKRIGAGSVTVLSSGSDLIEDPGTGSLTTSVTLAPSQSIPYIATAGAWRIFA